MILWSLVLRFFWAYFSSIFSSLIEISKRQTFMSRTLKIFLVIFILSPWYFARNVDFTFFPSGYRARTQVRSGLYAKGGPVLGRRRQKWKYVHRKYFQKQGVGHPIIAYTQYFRPSTTNFFDTLFSNKLQIGISRHKLQLLGPRHLITANLPWFEPPTGDFLFFSPLILARPSWKLLTRIS